MNFRRLFHFFERRKRNEPVAEERRRPRRSRHEQADAEYRDALSNFEQTVRMKREDFFKCQMEEVRQTIVFSTYREICQQRGPEIMGLRLCRHKQHPDAKDVAHAICDENKCPRIAMALQGIAA